MKQFTLVAYFAARDPRTPTLVRLFALIVAAYALSPIDLIPDFIPVLGYLDDLVLVPLGLALVIPALREVRAHSWNTDISGIIAPDDKAEKIPLHHETPYPIAATVRNFSTSAWVLSMSAIAIKYICWLAAMTLSTEVKAWS